MRTSLFGEFLKKRRLSLRMTLRKFCEANGFDPGNHSRLERGLFLPPKGEKLEQYAKALGLEPGSEEWQQFYDLAAASRGELPEDLLSDEQVVASLPLLFRTLRGDPVPDEQLDKLVAMIRRG